MLLPRRTRRPPPGLTPPQYLSIHNMVNWVVDSFGSEEMRQRLLPKMVTMERFSAYCLTEPGSGSDAAALRTTAVRDGDHFVVNGEKAFISCAGASGHGDDVFVVFCRTGGPGPKGITALMIEENYSEGISFGKNEHKMGWKAQPTRAVVLENVRVPVENVLGEENGGFKIAMQALNGGRVNIGACSVGSAQLAVEDTVAYTKERKMFGSTLAGMQTTRHAVAKMAMDTAASRLMVRAAARAIDENQHDKAFQCAAAKYFSTETCYNVVNRALQLHGGYGFLKDYPREQAVRDLRVHSMLPARRALIDRPCLTRRSYSRGQQRGSARARASGPRPPRSEHMTDPLCSTPASSSRTERYVRSF